jgi:hypothetical protein
MIDEIKKLLEEYRVWLKDNTTLREVEGTVEITTPYLDRHNDHIQIYVQRSNGGYILTDDSYTIQDLRLSGCSLDTEKRQDLLKATLNGFGIEQAGESLIIKTSKDRFAFHKHNLLQAILAVNDLFYLAEPMVKSLFLEDVTAWLDLSDIRYTPKVKFSGKSGYDHLFDFVIPKSKKKPERILQAINRPSKDTAQSMAFSWVDTREVRAEDAMAYAVLNDSERMVPSNVIEALHNYGVTPVLWSKKDQVRPELAA